MFGVPRCAWVLKYFGAENVRILNGGMKKWQAEGRPVVKNVATEKKTYNEEEGDYSYSAANPESCVTEIAEMHKLAGKLFHLASPAEADFQILDARSKGRFEGTTPEPRAGLRGGCIKNSLNMPID